MQMCTKLIKNDYLPAIQLQIKQRINSQSITNFFTQIWHQRWTIPLELTPTSVKKIRVGNYNCKKGTKHANLLVQMREASSVFQLKQKKRYICQQNRSTELVQPFSFNIFLCLLALGIRIANYVTHCVINHRFFTVD